MEVLEDELYASIIELTGKAESYFEDQYYLKAIELYSEALNLVPIPKTRWETSTWIYTAIGDSFFMLQDYQNALTNLLDAYNCPGGVENPFINLRLGQCYYETDNSVKTEDYLLRAYMIEGEDIFKSEDNKYFKYLKSKFNLS
ncbi:hypothetical protein [Aquimarina brevivitae]|uniref:Tetratricopeptide repeat protein n=1 Tax=Aquimarina brevivitae TaxID=323412 RepID=A0A4Q7NZQ3_9FLAO|nr:hypothetical protein [Aquimarina brevivitae]RZS92498.1 hypothetical protein EV197_2636 [Aquimarina brevivitae]